MTRRFSFLLIVAFILMAASVAMAGEGEWVEADAQVPVAGISPEAAQTMAKQAARVKAVSQNSGVSVQSETIVLNQLTAGNFVDSIAWGHVVEEQIIEHGYRVSREVEGSPLSASECSSAPGLCRQTSQLSPTGALRLTYFLRMRAKVQPDRGEPDPYFHVMLKLNRTLFESGDEALATITSSKECYINVLNITADEHVLLLMPSLYARNNRLAPGDSIQVPDETQRQDGTLRLIVRPMQGHQEDTEVFLVVATKQPLMIPVGKDFNVTDLVRSLAAVPPNERAQDQVIYTVRGR